MSWQIAVARESGNLRKYWRESNSFAGEPARNAYGRIEGATLNQLHIPLESTKLENGLRVVVSPDRTAPVATLGVYYNIGFRLEPQGRSGFAHLFEHMMFQGSEHAGKMMHRIRSASCRGRRSLHVCA